jgi:P-type Mg2+ transporter
MIVFGLPSSVSGILTFITLRLGFHASATLFAAVGFTESAITEFAVTLVLRTNRPFRNAGKGLRQSARNAALAGAAG